MIYIAPELFTSNNRSNARLEVNYNNYLTRGLINLWIMQDAGLIEHDLIGRVSGSLNNATRVVRDEGVALGFDGNTDYLDVGGVTRLEEGISHTIFGYVNPVDVTVTGSQYYTLFCSGNGTSANRVGVGIGGSEISCGIYDGVSYVNADSGSIAGRNGEWMFYVMTYDGANSALFIDGIKQSGSSSPSLDSGDNVYIGLGASGVDKSFDGDIAITGLYNRGLSDVEAVDLSRNFYQIVKPVNSRRLI